MTASKASLDLPTPGSIPSDRANDQGWEKKRPQNQKNLFHAVAEEA